MHGDTLLTSLAKSSVSALVTLGRSLTNSKTRRGIMTNTLGPYRTMQIIVKLDLTNRTTFSQLQDDSSLAKKNL